MIVDGVTASEGWDSFLCTEDRALISPNKMLNSPNRSPQGPKHFGEGGGYNFLFADGSVRSYRVEETIGTGTMDEPKGMWTKTRGD